MNLADWANLRAGKTTYEMGTDAIEDILEKLKKHKEESNLGPNDWILGFGFLEFTTKERRLLTRFDLDKVSKDQPILALHLSCHVLCLNSKALELLGIDANFVPPFGTVVQRQEGSQDPDGVVISADFAFEVISTKLPRPAEAQIMKKLELVQKQYLSYGVTTGEDAYFKKNDYGIIAEAAGSGKLKLDLVLYIDRKYVDEFAQSGQYPYGKYKNHVKFQGVKIHLDGSTSGSAWFTKPYEGTDNYGMEYCTLKEFEGLIRKALKNGWQMQVHAIGDAAIDRLVNSMQKISKEEGKDIKALRMTGVHMHGVRADQLDKVKELNIVPTFYTATIGVLAEAWKMTFGERAENMHPCKWALDRGIKFSMHTDDPIIVPDMIFTMWSAVNRKSLWTGQVLGAHQRISIMDALKAATINAAYQHFEEDRKGSITEGKIADMVILDRNPLKLADPLDMKLVQVVKTIKDGEGVYTNPNF